MSDIAMLKSPSVAATSVSSLTRTNVFIAYGILSIVAAVYTQYTEKQFLGDVTSDGFTWQVNYILNLLQGGVKLWDMEPLLWIHALRAMIAVVFVWIEDVVGPWAVTLVILVMFLPIFNLLMKFNRGIFALTIPLVIMFVSHRAALVVLSVGYCVMYLSIRNKAFLLISFFLANLSSGAVLNNLLIGVFIVRVYQKFSVTVFFYNVSLAISFVISAIDKYRGFSDGDAGYSSTVFGLSGFQAILSRSTIFVSFLTANYARGVAYVLLAAFGLAVLWTALRHPNYRGYGVIFLTAAPSFLLEGLGVVSLLVPLLLYAAGAPLPRKPELYLPQSG